MRGDKYDSVHQDLATGEGMREHPEPEGEPPPPADATAEQIEVSP
jgi:hypothetical protein